MGTIDNTPLSFGKYKGKTTKQIANIDHWYIIWMYENIDYAPCSMSLYLECIDIIKNSDYYFDSLYDDIEW